MCSTGPPAIPGTSNTVRADRAAVLPPASPPACCRSLTRTVRDTAMYLHTMQDPESQLPTLGFVSGKSPRRLKIALMYEGMHGQRPHREVAAAIADTASLCRQLGHMVEEAQPPLDQGKLAAAAAQLGAVETARMVDAIARARGITALESAFESRALGLREEALRRGPFDAQIAAALPILRAALRGSRAWSMPSRGAGGVRHWGARSGGARAGCARRSGSAAAICASNG